MPPLGRRLDRFHAPVQRIPASYLEAVVADPIASVVAANDHTYTVVAFASLIRNGDDGSADLGVLVEDAWHPLVASLHLLVGILG